MKRRRCTGSSVLLVLLLALSCSAAGVSERRLEPHVGSAGRGAAPTTSGATLPELVEVSQRLRSAARAQASVSAALHGTSASTAKAATAAAAAAQSQAQAQAPPFVGLTDADLMVLPPAPAPLLAGPPPSPLYASTSFLASAPPPPSVFPGPSVATLAALPTGDAVIAGPLLRASGVTDNGFVIALPSPPVAPVDLPEIIDGDRPPIVLPWDNCDDCNQNTMAATNDPTQLVADRDRIKFLLGRIRMKQAAVAEHSTWLEEATRARERLQAVMSQTSQNKEALQDDLKRLVVEKNELMARARRDRLQRDLVQAQHSLRQIESASSDLEAARNVLSRSAARTQSEIDRKVERHAQAAQLTAQQVKDKLREFREMDNQLAQIVQPGYPNN